MSLLRAGQLLMIAGDSITEQRQFGRIIESYLAACHPHLNAEVRQSGWSGESTAAFLPRAEADLLSFRPGFVISAYGMNDFGYDRFSPALAEEYWSSSHELARRIKASGAGQLLASPGCISLVPAWCERQDISVAELNASLAQIRDLGRALAESEGLAFSDCFQAMSDAESKARASYGPGFHIAGDDGVHPGWAGHMVMATAMLGALGLESDLGAFEMQAGSGAARTRGEGQRLLASGEGWMRIRSWRYPYCVGPGELSKNSSQAAGAALCGFHRRLNRLSFRLGGAGRGPWQLSWGAESMVVGGELLERGINLAELFAAKNPFSIAFGKLDAAVAAKQEFETWQLHEVYHGAASGREASEERRGELLRAVAESLRPLEHEIRIQKIS